MLEITSLLNSLSSKYILLCFKQIHLGIIGGAFFFYGVFPKKLLIAICAHFIVSIVVSLLDFLVLE